MTLESLMLNWDKECEKDIRKNTGYIVTDLNKPLDILSNPIKYTDYSGDVFKERYRCECKENPIIGASRRGERCPKCQSKVEYRMYEESTGWLKLNKHHIIQPAYYNKLISLIGKEELKAILKFSPEEKTTEENPFVGIGMIEFYRRFEEIVKFFEIKNNSIVTAYILLTEKDNVFAKHFPIITPLNSSLLVKERFAYSKIGHYYRNIVDDLKKVNSSDTTETEMLNRLYKIQMGIMGAIEVSFCCLSIIGDPRAL